MTICSLNFKECSERAERNSRHYRGQIIQKYMIKENLGNGYKPDFVIIVEYPSHEDAYTANASDENQQIDLIRQKAFKDFNVLIVG